MYSTSAKHIRKYEIPDSTKIKTYDAIRCDTIRDDTKCHEYILHVDHMSVYYMYGVNVYYGYITKVRYMSGMNIYYMYVKYQEVRGTRTCELSCFLYFVPSRERKSKGKQKEN